MLLMSAIGSLSARWKVNLTVYPGGARGMGVSSKPPAGFLSSFFFPLSLSLPNLSVLAFSSSAFSSNLVA